VIGSRISDNSAALPTGGEHKKNRSITLKLSLNSTKINATNPLVSALSRLRRGASPRRDLGIRVRGGRRL